ncbi:MAG TPA: glycosyltransferase family 2 protein [Saprospiraceae bacterium]|nr:glycosyltransferase family 2 protein [Saprospiraceae bacterium]HRW76082.1 glycosyltransferase family 2 protein [Saprospiraceae bacterium]
MGIALDNICIVIPAFNEGSVIGQVVQRVLDLGFVHVLVVDDGSTDDTRHQALHAGAHVIRHLINRGAGAAAQTGIKYVREHGFGYLIQIDADGQHYPEDMVRMCEHMANTQADIILGSRFIDPSPGIPAFRVFYNQLSNIFTNWFCTRWYSDTQSGFRMLGRRAIQEIDLQIDGFGYCSEMIVLADKRGLVIEEIPIRVMYTSYSMSKGQNLQMGINTALNILWKIIVHPKS